MTIPEADPISDGYPIVDAATWRAQRLEHLAAEKAFTREREALAAKRRELPWLEVDDMFASVPGSSADRSQHEVRNPLNFRGRSRLGKRLSARPPGTVPPSPPEPVGRGVGSA